MPTPKTLRLSDGSTVRVLDAGAGQPLLLIHGVGLRAEAILRDALNQAIATGAKQAPANASVAEAAEAAVAYAKRSSPDAIKKLGASTDVLLDKARAAIKALK